MERKPASLTKAEIPQSFHSYIDGATVYDSSCSKDARVWFIEKGRGFYLKRAKKSALQKEAAMTAYLFSKQLAPEILSYESLEDDWMLTVRAKGEDCIAPMYKDDPKRLCDTTAQLLRMLHEADIAGCPIPDHTQNYLATAAHNYRNRLYDASLFPDNWGYASAEEAWAELEANGKCLKTDTLLHGDYCLPNIMLDNWHFSAFIDVGNGGVGDKHIDLFWGMWSLQFNLKTDAYTPRFLDVYGREDINPEIFRTIAAAEVFG